MQPDLLFHVIGGAALLLLAASAGLALWTWRLLRSLPALQKGTVAFFHPFADGGGGGERVLW